MNAQAVIALLLVALLSKSAGDPSGVSSSSIAARGTLLLLRPVRSAATVPAAPATLEDFAWMAGHWTGTVDGSPMEEICSPPRNGLLMCMFRVFDEHTNVELEFRTFKQTPDGIEERVRFLSPDSGSVQPGEVFMVLRSFSPREAVFENPRGSQPKRETLVHSGVGKMVQRIEIVGDDGKPQVIEAHYVKRAP